MRPRRADKSAARTFCSGSFRGEERLSWTNLFFAQLLARGIYMPNDRTCFVSTAHSRADLARLVQEVGSVLNELAELGIEDLETNENLIEDSERPLSKSSIRKRSISESCVTKRKQHSEHST